MAAGTEIIVRRATDDELERVVLLRWEWARESSRPPAGDPDAYAAEALSWAHDHAQTHIPHVAIHPEHGIIGMAWLALTPRVPTAHALERWSGDLQSCYVLPGHRDGGIGGMLVRAVLQTAAEVGAEHVTVHASAESARMYARHGFRTSGRLLWADVAIDE